MSVPSEKQAALVRLGYTPEEARFIYIVAIHSGYFTHRQFLQFAGTKPGKHSQKFLDKLLSHRHATAHAYQSGALVYHIFSRKVFGVIERDNLRTRRKHQLDYIKARLMALDFVLSNPDRQYLETEAEKVPFFVERLGVSRAFLPSRIYSSKVSEKTTTRYFVDRFPLYIEDAATSAPTPAFTYLDPGLVTLQGFSTHLRAYAGLFQSLWQFELIFVAASERQFRAAESEFSRRVLGGVVRPSQDQLVRYFKLRRAWEAGQRVEAADVVFLNDARRLFRPETLEPLYRKWCQGSAVEADFAPLLHRDDKEVRGRISTLVCSQSLSIFERPREELKAEEHEKASTPFSPSSSPEVSPP